MSKSVLAHLEKLGETNIDFDFGRSVALASLFYKKLPVITVCGTNGKGSTCAFLESILLQSNYRAGVTISPHLESPLERIRILGNPISQEQFESYGQAFISILEKERIQPTYFEWITFLALFIFEETVDLAIFETGLGGRLDSTNAIPRMGAILTRVSLDHMQYLGHTLSLIAREKLPILQGSALRVVADQDNEVLEEANSLLDQSYLLERRDFFHTGSDTKFAFSMGDVDFGPILLGLRGNHQSSNAACAAALALELSTRGYPNINTQTVQEGLSQAENPGRLEKWTRGDVTLWLDVAHNPGGIDVLVQFLMGQGWHQWSVIFGTSHDKPYSQMVQKLAPITQEMIFVDTQHVRSWTPPDLELKHPLKALEELLSIGRTKILATGSFYHLGIIRRHLPLLGFQKSK